MVQRAHLLEVRFPAPSLTTDADDRRYYRWLLAGVGLVQRSELPVALAPRDDNGIFGVAMPPKSAETSVPTNVTRGNLAAARLRAFYRLPDRGVAPPQARDHPKPTRR
jgi:hypothetical protein